MVTTADPHAPSLYDYPPVTFGLGQKWLRFGGVRELRGPNNCYPYPAFSYDECLIYPSSTNAFATKRGVEYYSPDLGGPVFSYRLFLQLVVKYKQCGFSLSLLKTWGWLSHRISSKRWSTILHGVVFFSYRSFFPRYWMSNERLRFLFLSVTCFWKRQTPV